MWLNLIVALSVMDISLYFLPLDKQGPHLLPEQGKGRSREKLSFGLEECCFYAPQ
jgi:hypothetical protein